MHRPASWCRTSARHFAADLGRAGGLTVWLDAATGTWSAFVLGTQRTGFITAAAAQAAALRMARARLEEGLRRIEALAPAGHGAVARISTPPEPTRPALRLNIAASSSGSTRSIHVVEPVGSIASVSATWGLIR